MSKEQELIIKIRANADNAITEIARLRKGIVSLEKESAKGNTGQYGKVFERIAKGSNSLTASLKGLVAGMAALGISMKAVDFAKLAADAEQAADAFGKVVSDMGENAEVEFEKIKQASKGLISDADMRQSATTALSLGVPLKSLAQLMEVARVKSREMGTDVKSAFEDLATGIGRGSPMILDNLGLTIKLGEANQKMAASLGKTVEQLTKQEKIQALTNAVIEAGASSVKRYADASLSSKERMQAMNASLDNLKVKIGNALLPLLEKAAKAVTEWANNIDDVDMDRFSAGVDAVVFAMEGVYDAVKMLNDLAMPDWLAGENNAGVLDTAAKGWGLLGDQIMRAKNILDAIDSFSRIEGELSSLQNEMESFDGGAEAYETLSNKAMGLYSTLQKLKIAFQQSGSEEAKAQLKSVDAAIAILEKHIEELASKKPFDAFNQSAKEAANAVKKYSVEEIEAFKKVNANRIKEAEKTVNTLTKQEEKLSKEILHINENLAKNLQRIEQNRFETQKSLADEIRNIEYEGMNERTAYYAKIQDAETELSNARRALANGDLEQYREYINRYKELITSGGAHAIEVNGQVAISEEEVRQNTINGLRTVSEMENRFYDAKRQQAEQSAEQARKLKEIELEGIKARLEANKALLEVAGQLNKELGKKAPDSGAIDNINAQIAKVDELIGSLKEVQTTPARVVTDTSDVERAKANINELRQLTINGVTLSVDANTTPADFGIANLITKVEGDQVTMQVNPEYQKALEEIARFKKEAAQPITEKHTIKSNIGTIAKEQKQLDKPTHSTHTVKSNVANVKGRVKELSTPTHSQHTIGSNAGQVAAQINALKATTHSTHIIHIKEVHDRSEGGLIPQHLAGGGVFRGAGRVPGYDPFDRDKVNARLTGGEFVVRRAAVNKYGAEVFEAFNKLVPPKYAAGGQVGKSIGNNEAMANPTVVNLTIGSQTFKMMTDKEIADALSRFIETEGGL